jgi:hypothetical protein
MYVQSVPGGKVNILWGHSFGHSKQKRVYMCPIRKGFRDRAISLYTVQTSNMPCPHASYKVHWCWRWNFRKYIVLSKLYQLCHLNNKYRYYTQYIVSLSYQPFWNSSISETVRSRTHVHINFFCSEWPIMRPLKEYWPFLLGHPVQYECYTIIE